jgi:hypothetical protein
MLLITELSPSKDIKGRRESKNDESEYLKLGHGHTEAERGLNRVTN